MASAASSILSCGTLIAASVEAPTVFGRTTAPTRESVRTRLEWLMHDKSVVTDELVDVRYRIYSAVGLNVFEVATISGYIAMALGTGLTFTRDGVRVVVLGSVTADVAQAAARGLR